LIVADTSAILAFLNRRDQHNKAMVKLFLNEDTIIVPVPILGELASMVETRLGQQVMADFLRDCHAGGFTAFWSGAMLPRMEELVRPDNDGSSRRGKR
jgi:predicted nucleic acid-binding protein